MVLRSPLGWVGVVVLLAIWLFSGGLRSMFGGGEQRVAGEQSPVVEQQQSAEMVQFVSFVLDDVQTVWRQKFAARNSKYENAKLVLFTDQTRSACGFGSAASGPFYCPGDRRVYIDLSFYHELERRFGAPGDFAQAYVIGHEIGHHVQNLLGTSDRVHRAPRSEQQGATGLSVRLELQADCYAGIWAHTTSKRELLHEGDIDEGLNAASAIGDDRMQKRAGGVVSPESWTHGSSEMRTRWFRRGHESGLVDACDTFSANTL
jgi:hypothetical protein